MILALINKEFGNMTVMYIHRRQAVVKSLR